MTAWATPNGTIFLKIFQWLAESKGMRLGVLTGIVVLAAGAALWLVSSFSSNSGEHSTADHTFAIIESQANSELYLKDARAFIFSRTASGQSLKLHDSVLVGPKSEAILVLSDDFGGGRIQLLANTIITLSKAGRRNEIPRIEIKQGEIKVLKAPTARKKAKPSEELKLANTNSDEPALPGILISAGRQAVVLDEKLADFKLAIDQKRRDLEIKQGEESAAPPTTAQTTPASDLPKIIAAESLESLSMEDLSSEDTIAKEAPASTATAVEKIATESPGATQQQSRAKEDVPETTPTQAPPIAENPPTEAHQTHAVNENESYLELGALMKSRSYKDDASSENTLDLDISAKAKIPLTHTLRAALGGEVASIRFRKPSGGAPRPLSLSAEMEYRIVTTDKYQIRAVGGLLYQTTLGTGITAAYANVSSPVLGADVFVSFGEANLRASPRLSWIHSGSYFVTLPLTYFWDKKYGFTLSYSSLALKASGANQSTFISYGAGMNLKF
jgi:hypothetical protein